ncbi:YIP1 family protein [Albirhodobacter sp. R86504]|jgi:hypothetical protein|uniref:YIP1 family protein n=1 Tax=Albirhodobacter sp. R86504 TaxID=3093848 RepID=UPI00366C7E55
MWQQIATLMRAAVREPAKTVPAILGLSIPREARWLGLAAVVVISALATALLTMIYGTPTEGASPFSALMSSPLRMAFVQAAGILFIAATMAFVGRSFGGKGRFEDALLLVVWIEATLLVIQLAQLALALFVFPIFPSGFVVLISSLLGMISIILLCVMLVGFVKGLHGFTSTPAVLIGMIATLFGAGTVFMLLLSVLGIAPVAGV